jgi:hypothetical protein
MHRGVHDVASLVGYDYSLKREICTFCDTLYHLCGGLVKWNGDNRSNSPLHLSAVLLHGELFEESTHVSS